MISLARPLSVGNAIRLWLTPPAAAQWWRVLRRSSGAISGPNDPNAAVVTDLSREESLLDSEGLENGTAYTYQAFYWTGSAFEASATVAVTPAATYSGDRPSAQEIVRERLDLGLRVEVARGTLKPASGSIPVVTAPHVLAEGITFPCVSVHFDTEDPEHRGIGEIVLADERNTDGRWIEHDGWLASTRLSIVGVSLNGDERIALRKAIKRVILANLPVFAAAGMTLPTLRLRDTEGLGEDNATQYRVNGTFDFVEPAFVTDEAPAITDVTVSPLFEEPSLHGQA